MSTWYKLNLGNGMYAAPKTKEIQQDFSAFFIASGSKTTGALLFSRYDTQNDNVELFFNPHAEMIALKHAAQPCPKPALNTYRICLLCADTDGALAINFPGQGRP